LLFYELLFVKLLLCLLIVQYVVITGCAVDENVSSVYCMWDIRGVTRIIWGFGG